MFNIALLVPLGFYLRYYFRRRLFPSVLLALGVSLFFELTQLSGLYGIYPRAYRLFDVDDLICNTLGGFLGYVLTGPLMKVLPDRDGIDKRSYQKGGEGHLYPPVPFPVCGYDFCLPFLYAASGFFSALCFSRGISAVLWLIPMGLRRKKAWENA